MKTFKEEEAKNDTITVSKPCNNETCTPSQNLPKKVPNDIKLSKWQELLPQQDK